MSTENTERNQQLVKDKETMTYKEMEEKYGISRNTISKIIYKLRLRKLVEG